MHELIFEKPSPGITLYIYGITEAANADRLRAAYRSLWSGWSAVVEAGFTGRSGPKLSTLSDPHIELTQAQHRLLSSLSPKFLEWAAETFPPLQDVAELTQQAAVVIEAHDDLIPDTVAVVREYGDHKAVLCFDRVLLRLDRLTVEYLEVADPVPELLKQSALRHTTIALFEAPTSSEIGRVILQIGEFVGFAVGGVGGMVFAGVCDILPSVLAWFFTKTYEPQPSIPDLVQVNANSEKISDLGNSIVTKAELFQRYYDSAWDERTSGSASDSMWRTEAYGFFFENAGIDHDSGLYLKLSALETILGEIEGRVHAINRMVAAEQALFAQCVALHRLGARILYAILMAVHHVDNVDSTVKEQKEELGEDPEEIVARMTNWLRLLDEVVLPRSKAFEEKVAAFEASILKRRLEKITFKCLDRVTEDRNNPEMPYDHHPYAAVVDPGDKDFEQGPREWAYDDGLYLDKKRKKVVPTAAMWKDHAAHSAEIRAQIISRIYGNGMTEADNAKIREQQARLERMVKTRIELIREKQKGKPPKALSGNERSNAVSTVGVSIKLS